MIDLVNGYVCHNCSDVELAKRNIDPAHPKDGPAGVDKPKAPSNVDRNQAVTFGGTLAQTATGFGQDPMQATPTATRAGNALNIAV